MATLITCSGKTESMSSALPARSSARQRRRDTHVVYE
jgi:hypothetical protein